MYKRIDARRSVRKLYTEALVKRGDISLEEAEAALDDFSQRLQGALEETRQHAPPKGTRAKPAPPALGVLPHVATGISRDEIDTIFAALETVPEGFEVHPKLAKQFETRRKMFDDGEVDWALGEAMAYGSLLHEGTSVRLAGQDTRRGTFSHRHGVLVDYQTGTEHTPLAPLATDGAQFWLYDSLLSEYAALGFEYGYSVVNKDALVIWEAQFGDFFNGAQIIVDQYLVAAEDKWGQTSGLVLLLPHGYEGQGPEHSSGRIERFLTLAAEDNIQVCNATTAAQFFHLLRRQMRRTVRKPLIVFTPKSLLRAKASRSPIEALTEGSFEEVLDDPRVTDPDAVKRIVLCSGKVAYDALDARDRLGAPVAVVRVEQLFPWPFDGVARVVGALPERRPDLLAPGGAREHGPVERHQGPPVRGPQRPLDPPREPVGVGIAGHGFPRHPPAGAGGRGQPHLRQPRLTLPDPPRRPPPAPAPPSLPHHRETCHRSDVSRVVQVTGTPSGHAVRRWRCPTIDRVIHELASSQHGAFSRAQARQRGITRQMLSVRLRRGDLRSLGQQVLVATAAPDTELLRATVATLVVPGAALSHRSAAAYWGLPGFRLEPLEILTCRPGRAVPHSSLARIHTTTSLPENHLTIREGLVVTVPARVLFDLAGLVHPRRLERLVDTAWRMRLVTGRLLRRTLAELASAAERASRSCASSSRLEATPTAQPTATSSPASNRS